MTNIVFLLFSVVSILAYPVCANAAESVPYTSRWGDFKTSIPDGWSESSDFEGDLFTDTNFRSSEHYYSLAIRWYKRYNPHHMSDGHLEMYSGADDYATQISDGMYGGSGSELVEPVHDVMVGGLKAKRFVARTLRIGEYRTPRLGVLVRDEVLKDPGEHAYTVVAVPGGIYVLIYFAPKGGFGKYEKQYNQMVASFVPQNEPQSKAKEKPGETLEQYISSIKSQKGIRSGLLFSNIYVQSIELVSKMKPAPAIPEEAMRNFVKAATFLKAAKEASDYGYAIDAFKEALYAAPWWGDAYYNLGIALELAGHYDDAVESVKMYLLTKPGEPYAGQAQRKIYEIEAKKELAQVKERKFTEEVDAGRYSFHGGSYDDAIMHWKKALGIYPDHKEVGQVYCNMGNAYVNKELFNEAIEYGKKCVELKPGLTGGHTNLGVALQNMGRWKEACDSYRKACGLGSEAGCKNLKNANCPK